MTVAPPPTPEQQRILDAFPDGANMVIVAAAGSGKTTSLKMIANTAPRRKGLYLAYNRAIADDAKASFPGSVNCVTAHALAYRAIGHRYKERLNGPRVPAGRAAAILGIHYSVTIDDKALQPAQLARLANETVARFCHSADEEPGTWHVPAVTGLEQPEQRRAVEESVYPLAVKVWEDVRQLKGQLRFTHDCQPPGTMVTVVTKGYNNHAPGETALKPIEDIREGDKVVSWGGSRLGYVRRAGRAVTKVGSRRFEGELITAKTPTGHQSSYTPEHICIAMIADALDGKHVVYLMRRGDDYRIGRTPWRLGSQGNTFGPVHRGGQQGADALWVLSAHDDPKEAALAEALAQHRFNIPGWQFRSSNEFMPLDEFWSAVGGNATPARICLAAHGRDIRFPLWENDGRHYQRRPIEIRACNLMDGMRVCVVDEITPNSVGALIPGGWTDAWQPVTLSRAPYSGPVYFLDVDTDHTYVADGIVTHNCYLKLFGLSRPSLPYDYVLFDEAQDANAVVLGIVKGQENAQVIAVGDPSQAIYGWRGSVDSMGQFDAKHRLHLSKSFRFGPAVADEANKWLDLLNAELRVEGFERVSSTVGPLAVADAVLCRTNAGAIGQVMAAIGAGQRAALVGGGDDMRRLAEAAVDLKAGRGTAHPELFAFRTWAEVQDHAENDPAGSDLKVFVQLVDKHGPDVIIDTLSRLTRDESRADVVISTAHKAKGREWRSVQIAGDFREPKDDEDGQQAPIPRPEMMLSYVAVTRAKLALDPAGVAWVGRYLKAPSSCP